MRKNKLIHVHELEQRFFNRDDWFFHKRKINMTMKDQYFIARSNGKRKSYLMFLNDERTFSTIRKERIVFNDDIYIELLGNLSDDLHVTIFLLQYNKKMKREKTYRLKLNEGKWLRHEGNERYLRFVIRMDGVGELTLHTCTVATEAQMSVRQLQRRSMQEIVVASILDEFSKVCFQDSVSLVTFTPYNWKTILEKNKPDFLLVESAWKGNEGTWAFEIAQYRHNHNNAQLRYLIAWCRRHHIPTVFWNKEDPVHFNKFIKTAELFHYVFTTDADMIPHYKRHLNHDRIYALPFAAHPLIHHPIATPKTKKRLMFAGTYYNTRYPKRKKVLDRLLTLGQLFGLDIYDRNAGGDEEEFLFPDRFQRNIVGSLAYEDVVKAYRHYRLIFNINSVTTSRTMFARRVFEALACGTPVVSNLSVGMKKMLPGLVIYYDNDQTTYEQMELLMTDDKQYRAHAMQGMRAIFKHHTYGERMGTILQQIGLPYEPSRLNVTIIIVITSLHDVKKAVAIIEHQTFQSLDVIFLLDIFTAYETVMNEYNTGIYRTYLMETAYRYEALQSIVKTTFVTVFDLDCSYGAYYIEDLVYSALYSQGDIIGKKSLFDGKAYHYSTYEYQFVDMVVEETALFRMSVLKGMPLRQLIEQRAVLINDLFAQGKRVFSSDKFNFRRNKETSS